MAYHPIPTEQIIERLRHAVHFRTPKSAAIAEGVQLGGCYTTLAFAAFGDLFAGHLVFGDYDKFTLNEREIETYHLVFDEMHIVCGEEHLRQAEMLLSGEWAIWCADHQLNGDVVIVIERRGSRMVPESPYRIQERRRRQNRLDMASLLTDDHVLAALEEAGKGLKPAEARDLIADTFAIDEIRDLVRASFALRYPPRGRITWLQ